MIISPARFEDEANKIISSTEDRWTKLLRLDDLMLATLDSMGYSAGVRRITGYTNDTK